MKNKLYEAANPENPYWFRSNVFMWTNRTLFFGALEKLEFHSMGTVAINIGLYQPFYLKTANGLYQPYRCAIIPAGYQHELQANRSVVASLMIEKNSADFVSLTKQFPFCASTVTRLDDVKWIQYFQKIYHEKPAKVQIAQLIDQLLDVNNDAQKIIDPRIAYIMQAIQEDIDNELDQNHLAALAGLSTSRFRHLFREQSDISYCRYRIWRRVISAIEALHKVDNLTHAAMEAGFTDAAHFNRCFRGTFGINPSMVFRNIDRFDV